MQFELKLTKEKRRSALPLNYRYGFSKAVSKLMDKGIAHHPIADSADFQNRVSKSFTFGNFSFDSHEIHKKDKKILHLGEEAAVEIRFLIDDKYEDRIKRFLLRQQFDLGRYEISSIRSLSPIDFQDVMAYRCVCPISLVIKCPSGNTSFLSPEDQYFNTCLKVHLIKRLLRFHPEVTGLEDLEQYCPEFKFQLLSEPKEKGFHIKSNDGVQNVIGYQFDFQLKASPVLHELGFYEGFGLQHSMGLGFVEVIA
jgi:CRISPR-associated endoribonuclease Cas6